MFFLNDVLSSDETGLYNLQDNKNLDVSICQIMPRSSNKDSVCLKDNLHFGKIKKNHRIFIKAGLILSKEKTESRYKLSEDIKMIQVVKEDIEEDEDNKDNKDNKKEEVGDSENTGNDFVVKNVKGRNLIVQENLCLKNINGIASFVACPSPDKNGNTVIDDKFLFEFQAKESKIRIKAPAYYSDSTDEDYESKEDINSEQSSQGKNSKKKVKSLKNKHKRRNIEESDSIYDSGFEDENTSELESQIEDIGDEIDNLNKNTHHKPETQIRKRTNKSKSKKNEFLVKRKGSGNRKNQEDAEYYEDRSERPHKKMKINDYDPNVNTPHYYDSSGNLVQLPQNFAPNQDMKTLPMQVNPQMNSYMKNNPNLQQINPYPQLSSNYLVDQDMKTSPLQMNPQINSYIKSNPIIEQMSQPLNMGFSGNNLMKNTDFLENRQNTGLNTLFSEIERKPKTEEAINNALFMIKEALLGETNGKSQSLIGKNDISINYYKDPEEDSEKPKKKKPFSFLKKASQGPLGFLTS